MDVPAPFAGVVSELRVAVGDRVSEGSVLLVRRAGDAEPASATAPEPPAPASAALAAAARARRRPAPPDRSRDAEVVVIGAGHRRLHGAFRAADLGLKTVLVERYADLGGVCLNVGCIPSKALLHAARVIAEAEEMAAHGIAFGEPKIDLDEADRLEGLGRRPADRRPRADGQGSARSRSSTARRGSPARTRSRVGERDAQLRATASSPPAPRPRRCRSSPTTRGSSTRPARSRPRRSRSGCW